MAELKRRRGENVAGSMFVDASCIDCGTCRWIAPESFDDSGGYSRVWRQPDTAQRRQRALMALVACPTASIGSTEKQNMAGATAAFPERIAGEVYHCGFHSEKSYGAASYFIRRPQGNVLVDSPRFARPLMKRLEDLGGISLLFLTHRDDVADHAQFARHFGCTRVIHVDDAIAAREAERRIEGPDPVTVADDLVIVPVPGHTRGSMCLLYRNEFLFTGDHLHWEPETESLGASRHVCWHDWREQTRSMARLQAYTFEWVLPGHGRRCHMPAVHMARALADCVRHMATQ